MLLYNTFSRQKEEFKPIEKGKVKIYSCGPTVYSHAQLGNMTSYLMADIVKKYLEFSGYEVLHIMNFTDFGHLTKDSEFGEDKMVKAAKSQQKTPEEIAHFYENAFKKDLRALNIKFPQKFVKASMHVPDMIELIKTLIEKGFAYEANGNVFFITKKYQGYGKLSGNTLESLKTGNRMEPHPDKKDPLDFMLWQKVPKNYPLGWDSPWGRGFPGWHIECSAMSTRYLGLEIDIHTGGEDNIFPHHECEIAQTESATGKKFVNYWIHKRHMMIDGKRMGKSEGNAMLVEDMVEKGYSPIVFRFFTLSSHYRSNLNFTWEAMNEALTKIERIIEFKEKLEAISNKQSAIGDRRSAETELDHGLLDAFVKAMDDDLNTPLAIANLFDFMRKTNIKIDKNKLKAKEASKILGSLAKLDKVLGILEYKPLNQLDKIKIEELIRKRDEARKNKDFETSDQIRVELFKMGVEIKDTNEGTIWKTK